MPNKYGRIIVFEGLDCCFKETQSLMLSHHLKTEFPELNVKLVDFPQYSTPSGQLVYDFLHGKYGDPKELSPQFISDLYSIDRACNWHGILKKDCDENTVFIMDRYTYSNCIYQTTRLEKEIDKNDPFRETSMSNFILGIINREYNIYGLPRPDIVLHMDMDFNIMRELLAKKKDKDINELNTDFLLDCYEMGNFFYGKVMKDDPTIHHIACNIEDEVRTREEIHNDIWEVVLPLIQN